MTVEVSAASSPREWDAFVSATSGASIFHLIGWQAILERTFGFTTHYLCARRGGEIAGVLPLAEMRPAFGDPRLLSLPLATEAGVLAADDEARRALERAAVALATRRGAHSLELRDQHDGDGFDTRAGIYFRFRRELKQDESDNLAAVPRKQRRMIRRALAQPLAVEEDDDIATFYDLYACSQRRLGTPVLPRSYFELLRRSFADRMSILTVRSAGRAAAAVLSFWFDGAVVPYYAGSRREYFELGVNDRMYWELMRRAAARGVRQFHFGRSRLGSGAFDYKRHWGFEAEELRYRAHALGQSPAPQRTVDDPRIRALSRAWRHLPLPITKWLGPVIARRFAPYFT